MVPVQAVGFDGLVQRMNQQDERNAMYLTKLTELETTLTTVKQDLDVKTSTQLAELQHRHRLTAQRMLHVRSGFLYSAAAQL